MAGIGFELKKLFSRKGLVATVRAYGYATMVCAGPMLLGFLLLLACMFMADFAGAVRHSRELLVTMLTHALVMSLVVTSLFSMLTTRFCADMLYEKKYAPIITSFYGSLWIMLILGGVLYGIFLHFSGVALIYRIQSWALFMVLIVVWTEINYLTMLKNYRSIIAAFAVSALIALLLGALLIWLFKVEVISALMASVTIGYSVMLVWYFRLIYQYFPEGKGTSLRFLQWLDTMPQLSVTGFLVTVGLFGHLVDMWWFSKINVQVEGLFYGAPTYDVPAIFAFFSILVTTVNFNTFVETRFYVRYKEYFSLFNDGGSIKNINEAEQTMIHILADELGYMSLKQIFSTLIFIIFGSILLPLLPLGFSSEMLRTFRVLCVGYAFYAIGNSVMLCSQYFADLTGALLSALVFAIVSNVATVLLAVFVNSYWGFGFLLGSLLFAVVAIIRLCAYLRKLKYHVLSRQPLFAYQREGIFTRLADTLDRRALRVQRRYGQEEFNEQARKESD